MKTKLVFLLLLIVCISCGTNNKTVSDAQKEKIKGEVKDVVNTFFKGCDEVNFDMVMGTCFDSPDFVYIYNGSTLSYKDCVDAFKPLFSTQINQKNTIVDEKYAFLDNYTVLCTINFKGISNFKDGHSSLADPVAMLLIFKKIDGKWKIIYGVESSIEKNVASESSKGLNQVELHKQYIGNWETEVAKDTAVFWDAKSYGTGLEGYFKFVAKGKIVMEGKQIWGYDKKLDKFILSDMPKGMDNGIYSTWFVSKNKCEMLPFSDISNPEKAPLKWEDEFKSPDMYFHKTIVNNKTVKTDTYTRVKQ